MRSNPTTHIRPHRTAGAIDYETEDFAERLSGYDVVLHSLPPDLLKKSLAVLRPGGKLISISGPPDPAFGAEIGANKIVSEMLGALSLGVRGAAKKKGAEYSFLFMRADGGALAKITEIVEAGAIRPMVNKVFAFDQTTEALERVETGHGRGKVVVQTAG